MTKKEITALKLANLGRALVDLELTHLDLRVLGLMVVVLANGETGIFRRSQIELAQMLGVTTRAVRRCLDRLVPRGYLEPIGVKPGKYISAYNVLGAKSGPYGPVSAAVVHGNRKADPTVRIADPRVQNADPPFPHTSLSIPHIFPSADLDTDGSGPRQRADALGPPLGKFDADLRRRLGEEFKWLSMAKLVAQTADTVTLSVLTVYQGDNIRKHCEAAILEVTGVSKLEFRIELDVRMSSTILQLQRIQCARCRSVHVLKASKANQWGQELYDAGWRARLIDRRYRHACSFCADELLAEFEGKRPHQHDL